MPIFCCNCETVLMPQTPCYYDRICMLTFCLECQKNLKNINICLSFRKGQKFIGACKKGHEIFTMPTPMIKKCSFCRKKKMILLFCPNCEEDEGYFCSSCLPPSRQMCYCTEDYLYQKGTSLCLKCEKLSDSVVECQMCSYCTCIPCFKEE